MFPLEIVSLIVWAAASFLIAFYLQRRYSLFRKLVGVLALFGCFVLFLLLHNLIYGLFQSYFDARGADEPLFFLLSFLSLGAAIFLLVIQIGKRIKRLSK